MVMTDEEIARHYRLAKEKRSSIQILADLNATGTGEIRAILEQAGEIEPEPTASPKAKAGSSARNFRFDEKLAMKLYKQGLPDAQIVASMGVSTSTICVWRNARNLPPNRKNCTKTEESVQNMKKITENHENTSQAISCLSAESGEKTLVNPVLLKIQKLLDMVSPGDSPKVSGQYLDLMTTMLSVEVERIAMSGK